MAFAANLLDHFVEKRGDNDYVPTQSDKREIIEYGSPKIIGAYVDRIFESLREPHGIRTNQNTESHFVAVNGDGTWRTIRWLPFVDNDNMAFAYGGADIIGAGEVDLNRRLVTDKELLMSEITGWFSVRIRDYYKFDTGLKGDISARFSEAYEAALFLEVACNYPTFWHEARVRFEYEDGRLKQ